MAVLACLLAPAGLEGQHPGRVAILAGVRPAAGPTADQVSAGPWVSLRLLAPAEGPWQAGLYLMHSAHDGRDFSPDVVAPGGDSHPDVSITSGHLGFRRESAGKGFRPILSLTFGPHWLRQSNSPVAQSAIGWGLSAGGGVAVSAGGIEWVLEGGYDILLTDRLTSEGLLATLFRLGIGITFAAP